MQHSSNSRILIIDDYSDSSQLIDMLLYIKKCNYHFSTANTPSKSLELIASQPFNLYIIEYKLPEMNGIELCRQIRQADQQTPILFFTRTDRAFARESSIAAGATQYLVKPADLEQITDTIKSLLGENAPVYAGKTKSITNYNVRQVSQMH
jgi:two-component system alkaline phosphatase synthesis response regulator PhoP